MLGNIIVWIISFFIGFYVFLWLFRPLLIHHKFKSSQGLLIHLFTCLIAIAILVGLVLLIYFKFSKTFTACIVGLVTSLVAVIASCKKEQSDKNI